MKQSIENAYSTEGEVFEKTEYALIPLSIVSRSLAYIIVYYKKNIFSTLETDSLQR